MDDEFSQTATHFPNPFRLLVRDECGSTNDELRELARQGAPEGLVLLARRQTSGRGRRGAHWFAPEAESLTFSVLLRPNAPKAHWPRLSLAAGVAVAEALEACGVPTGIKWPNDVWIHGRKVAGILVDAGENFAVVGIGLNVNTVNFSPEVAEIATSLKLATAHEYSRAHVLTEVIRHLDRHKNEIDNQFPVILSSVRRLCVLTGNQVALKTTNGPLHGTVIGIAPGGELLLETKDGLKSILQADEVRIKPFNNMK